MGTATSTGYDSSGRPIGNLVGYSWTPSLGVGLANGMQVAPATTIYDAQGNATGRGTPIGTGIYQSDLQRAGPSVDPGAQQAMAGSLLQSARGFTPDQVTTGQVQGAGIDSTGFNQQMAGVGSAGQMAVGNIGALQSAASGAVPSAAELQGRMQLSQALANTSAMGASSRGSADSRASAQRQAMMTNAALSGQVLNQSMAGRAAEQAQARAQLTGAIQGQQGFGLQGAQMQSQLAQAQAGLNQQASLANQGAGLQASLANQNAGMQNQGMMQGALLNAAQMYQQGYGNQMQGLDYNNQLAQMDFNRQMAMNGQQLQRYGVDKGVAVQQYQADQARAAQEQADKYQMYGSLINTAGTVAAAALK